ncbi:MAG TPA: glycosyltransferase family 2 protein, partial [bacterium]|nr:glycosyltransferase family 2 protein [bacterium]
MTPAPVVAPSPAIEPLAPADFAFEATVIVPAYNEAENIVAVIAEIRSLGRRYEVLVVDDCSTDGTLELAAAAGARVLQHPYNKGNGAAVKTGIRNARADKVVIIDGDGQHPAEMIPEIVSRLETYDLVVGARTRSSET